MLRADLISCEIFKLMSCCILIDFNIIIGFWGWLRRIFATGLGSGWDGAHWGSAPDPGIFLGMVEDSKWPFHSGCRGHDHAFTRVLADLNEVVVLGEVI